MKKSQKLKMQRENLFVESVPGLNTGRYAPLVGILLNRKMDEGKRFKIKCKFFFTLNRKMF